MATSLISAEGIIKHCGMLRVNNKVYKLTPHYLTKSHRPIICRKIMIHELALNDSSRTNDQYNSLDKKISDEYAEKLLMEQFK